MSMWSLIPKKQIPPTRIVRYCCKELKETSTPNRVAVLGVRAAESSLRKGRDVFGTRGGTLKKAIFFSMAHTSEVFQEAQRLKDDVWDCTLIKQMKQNKDVVVNPIYDWKDGDIWEYIKQENIKVNPMYARGYERVGCIGCPLATYRDRLRQFKDYPIYKTNYIKAFQRMLDIRKEMGKDDTGGNWKDGESLFEWWIQKYKYEVKGQMSFTEEEEE